MTDEPTPGVLLKGEDGSHYFIPHTDLSAYAVEGEPGSLDQIAANPRLDAISVQKASGEPGDASVFVVIGVE